MSSDPARPSPLQRQLRKRNPFASSTQEAHLNLARSHEFLAGHFARFFKEHGLSWTQYNILRILRGQGGDGVPCQQVGEQMVTLVPDVTRLVDRLVESGLAQRRRTSQDRRVVLVALTAKGRKLLERLEQPVLELHDHTLGHLTPEELTELSRLLVKARQPWEVPVDQGGPPPKASADSGGGQR